MNISKSIIAILLVVGCGGNKNAKTAVQPESIQQPCSPTGEIEVVAETPTEAPAQELPPEVVPPEETAPEVGQIEFVLNNQGKEDLVLSLDKGWQPVIYAYSGKPPKAKSIIMFPMHCTANCEEKKCLRCKEAERVRDIIKSEKRKVIAPGDSISVPWDGLDHVYKKTRASGRSCKCFTKQPAPPEVYTVRACGLRVTKSATKRSKYHCAEGTMTLPMVAGQEKIELLFK